MLGALAGELLRFLYSTKIGSQAHYKVHQLALSPFLHIRRYGIVPIKDQLLTEKRLMTIVLYCFPHVSALLCERVG